MYIEHLKDGRVKFGQYYEDYLTGKRKKVTVTMNKDTRITRKLAEEELERKISEINGDDVKPNQMTMKRLTALYLEDLKSHVKRSTYDRNYRFCNSTLNILGPDTLLDRMTSIYIKKQFESTGADAGGLNERLKRFKTMWRWAYRQGFVESTVLIDRIEPWKDVPHRAKIEDKYLEKEELKAVLKDMQHPLWRDLAEFMALSGLRFGEAACLTAADIDLDNRYIHVSKTVYEKTMEVTPPKTYDSNRDVYIQKELLPLCTLLRNRSGGGLIFNPERSTKPFISYYSFNKYLKKCTRSSIGRQLTTHALRHTHASLCAEAGMDFESISRRLGHSDSEVTRQVYIHITGKMKEADAAAIEDVKMVH